jgi:hypothetical protein
MRTYIAVVGGFVLGSVALWLVANGVSESRAAPTGDTSKNTALVDSWAEVVKAIEANESPANKAQYKLRNERIENAADSFEVRDNFYSIDVFSEELIDHPSLELVKGVLGVEVNYDSGLGERLDQHLVRFLPRDGVWVLHSIETTSYRPKENAVPRRTRRVSVKEYGAEWDAMRQLLTVNGIELR